MQANPLWITNPVQHECIALFAMTGHSGWESLPTLADPQLLNCTVASSCLIVALNGRQKQHAKASLEWFLHADTHRQEQRSDPHYTRESGRPAILAGGLLDWHHYGFGSRSPDPTA